MASPSADVPLEVEWQFDAADLEAATGWLDSAALPGFTVRLVSDRVLTDRYFDSADWRLHRGGYTARLRETAGKDGCRLTVKSMAAAEDGLRTRREYEETLPSGATPADAAASPGAAGLRVRTAAGHHALAELFTVRTARRTYSVDDASGTVAEVALDLSQFFTNGSHADGRALRRIEVELGPGVEPARARRFLDVLAVIGRMTPAAESKFEAAMAAAALAGPRPFDFGPTSVAPDQTTAEAAFAIVRRQFAIFLANESGTRLGEDIEALHDMRVAARRLRAAMAAFGAYLSPSLQRYRNGLGWVAAALGEVRDLDVHLEEFAAYHGHLEPDVAAGLAEVEAVLRADREAARKRMLRALDSARYQQLVDSFGRALRRGPPRTFAPGQAPVLEAGPTLLRRRYRALRRLGDAITPASPPADYHLLRIGGKKLRYALEFLGPLYGKPAIEFSLRVTALQDVLGRHQDLDVAAATLQAVADRMGRRLSPRALVAVGILAERNRQEAALLRRQFPSVYGQLKGPRWRAVERAAATAAPRPAGSPAGRPRSTRGQ